MTVGNAFSINNWNRNIFPLSYTAKKFSSGVYRYGFTAIDSEAYSLLIEKHCLKYLYFFDVGQTECDEKNNNLTLKELAQRVNLDILAYDDETICFEKIKFSSLLKFYAYRFGLFDYDRKLTVDEFMALYFYLKEEPLAEDKLGLKSTEEGPRFYIESYDGCYFHCDTTKGDFGEAVLASLFPAYFCAWATSKENSVKDFLPLSTTLANELMARFPELTLYPDFTKFEDNKMLASIYPEGFNLRMSEKAPVGQIGYDLNKCEWFIQDI